MTKTRHPQYTKDGTPIMDSIDDEPQAPWDPIKIQISNLKHQRTALRNQLRRERRLTNQKKRLEFQCKQLAEKLALQKTLNTPEKASW